MKMKTSVRRVAAVLVAVALCLALSGMHSFESWMSATAAQPTVAAVSHVADATGITGATGAEGSPAVSHIVASSSDILHFVKGSSEQSSMVATDESVRARDKVAKEALSTEGRKGHWSIFNLVLSILNLVIALGLVAYLGFSVLREERLDEDAWERLKELKTPADVRHAAALYREGDRRSPALAGAGRRPTAFGQFCVSVCVGLALVSVIVFFLAVRMDGPSVLFDALSPLFAVIFALVAFGAVLTVLSGRKTARLEDDRMHGVWDDRGR
jgi:hypothetical protein